MSRPDFGASAVMSDWRDCLQDLTIDLKMDRQHGTFFAAASVTDTLRHEGDGTIDQLVTVLDFCLHSEASN